MKTRAAGKGFSLTELLVVVAVILILISFLVVGVDTLYTHVAQLRCQHNMEQVWQACQMYSSANRGQPPPGYDYSTSKAWYDLLVFRGYLGDTRVTSCPSEYIAPGAATTGQNPGTGTVDTRSLRDVLRWFADPARTVGGRVGTFRPAAVTGLALSAFLGLGSTDVDAEFGNNVKAMVDYLVTCVNTTSGGVNGGNMYDAGVYVMAMSDASMLLSNQAYKDKARAAAQLAFSKLLALQTSIGGYNYNYGADPLSPDTDNSVSSWVYQGMAAGIKAGLSTAADPNYMTKADAYFARCCNGTGTPGKSTYYRVESYGSRSRFRITPAILACRLLMGHKPDEQTSKDMMTFIDYLDPNGLTCMYWNVGEGDISGSGTPPTVCQVYYIYYATLARYMMGDTGAKAYWSIWKQAFPPDLMKAMVYASGSAGTGTGKAYWPKATDVYPGNGYTSDEFVTALACIAAEVANAEYLPGSKWYTARGYSYGYNKLLDNSRLTPSNDTIVLMDYTQWIVDIYDPPDYLAPRHGGKANILFADGRVLAWTPDKILDPSSTTGGVRAGLLTPVGGD